MADDSKDLSVVPLIWVADAESSMTFYCEKLGFRMVNAWRPDDVLAWCSLTKGTAQLMLQQHDKGRKFQKPHGIQLYLICQDLDQVYAEIQARGGAPTDISDAFYNMRQFFVTDPDGNHICFESPVET
ncbi:MAG: VOC family protein [Pseudomonadales bacterium]